MRTGSPSLGSTAALVIALLLLSSAAAASPAAAQQPAPPLLVATGSSSGGITTTTPQPRHLAGSAEGPRRALRQIAAVGGGGALFGRQVGAPALVVAVPAGNLNSATARCPPPSRARSGSITGLSPEEDLIVCSCHHSAFDGRCCMGRSRCVACSLTVRERGACTIARRWLSRRRRIRTTSRPCW